MSSLDFFADQGKFTQGDFSYTVSAGKATLVAFNSDYEGGLIIPSSLGGCPVVAIGDGAFFECRFLTSVELPEGVTSLGNGAFSRCYALASVKLPKGVASIGEDAFFECRSLTSAKIPKGVTAIEFGTFCGCRSLTSVDIPESVTTIDDVAFERCCSLASVKLPSSLASIGEEAFGDCDALTSVVFLGRPCKPGRKIAIRGTGIYSAAYAAAWEAVLEADGTWRGLEMVCAEA